MITYTWIFNPLECYPEKEGYTDVVFKVYWQLTAVDQVDASISYMSTTNGIQSVPLPSGSFIPYGQLTFEIVQGWVEDAMGPEGVDALKANLASDIQRQKNPPTLTLAAPWYNNMPTP